MYLGWYLPRTSRRALPSMEPVVPSSARKKDSTWSGLRFMPTQISLKLVQAVRVVPTRDTAGGLRRRFSLRAGAGGGGAGAGGRRAGVRRK